MDLNLHISQFNFNSISKLIYVQCHLVTWGNCFLPKFLKRINTLWSVQFYFTLYWKTIINTNHNKYNVPHKIAYLPCHPALYMKDRMDGWTSVLDSCFVSIGLCVVVQVPFRGIQEGLSVDWTERTLVFNYFNFMNWPFCRDGNCQVLKLK